MDIILTETNKGKKSLVCDSFRYRVDKTLKGEEISWRCTAKGCKARLRTDCCTGTVIIQQKNTHNHDTSDRDNERHLLRLCSDQGHTLQPKAVHVDFEERVMKVMKDFFPSIEIKCCRFHLGQAWWRKIQKVGLSQQYKELDSDISKWLKGIFGIAFLAPDEVADCFVEDFMAVVPNDKPCIEFADYLTDTYITDESLFPPHLWAEVPSSCQNLVQKMSSNLCYIILCWMMFSIIDQCTSKTMSFFCRTTYRLDHHLPGGCQEVGDNFNAYLWKNAYNSCAIDLQTSKSETENLQSKVKQVERELVMQKNIIANYDKKLLQRIYASIEEQNTLWLKCIAMTSGRPCDVTQGCATKNGKCLPINV
ncbi:Hypothetical predicted protein [Mytilus galloprovincialis]|uniref:FLYWCH-type domain-containing protein n=1 Tax=Mytilus galloprovincialis TaxID=29158 RepID=A0A8B6E5W0_MYTGA|nr:Hypothetical predicted protein [Mytilus galloprovincialis]